MVAINQMLIYKAMSYYGMAEQVEGKLNQKIDNMLDIVRDKRIDDNWSWCSAFMISIAKSLCLEHSNSLVARSWLKVGEEVQIPILGDVVIFWRVSKDSWQGHVGLFVGYDGIDILCLGGNQNDTVRVSKYPAHRVLGFRRLSRRPS